jgi:FtsP/CotA-like multicopper oxidase with cupredoxin domain
MRNRREADSTETLNTSGRGQGATGLSRRSFLKAGAAGALITGGFALPFGSSASTADWISTLPAGKRPTPYTRPFQPAPRLPYRELSDADGPYRLYTVTERLGNAQIIDGLPTPVLGYGYQGVDGQPRLSVPGPVISVDQGTRVKLRVKNDLPATHPQWRHPMHTSTHLHGSASLPQYDGYADDVTLPGQYKDYWYPNFQAARTLWYHDHGVHNTAQNAYSGLAAQYHLHDAAELDLLPQGRYDVPLTIGDAMFAADGSLAYSDRNHSGLWGDVVLVNGVPWPYMEVQRRVYRFRILAATLSRSFNFRLVNVANGQQVPVHVVATDGGLMPKSQQVASWRQAGAERYEVLVDFGQFKSLPAGSKFQLRNTSNDNNVDYLHTGKVMEFRLTNEPVTDTRNNTIPTTLVTSTVMGLTAAQSRRTGDWTCSTTTSPTSSRSTARPGTTCRTAASGCWPTAAVPCRPRVTWSCGRSRTSRAVGSTRCTSTCATSRSSAARVAAAGSSPGSRVPRTSSTSARARSSGSWPSTTWSRPSTPSPTRSPASRTRSRPARPVRTAVPAAGT